MKRIGTYTTGRESGTKGGPVIIRKFHGRLLCCASARRGYTQLEVHAYYWKAREFAAVSVSIETKRSISLC